MSFSDKRILQRLRVPLGFLFGIFFLIIAEPNPLLLLAGAMIAAVGLLVRAWAAGHIRKNRELAVSGPYAFTRNPLYLGSFFLGLGFCVSSGIWWIALVFSGLFLGIYLPVMSAEAKDLLKLFGSDYEAYAEAVPLFFPWRRGYKSSGGAFDPGLFMHHREYRAGLGFIVAWGILAAKLFF